MAGFGPGARPFWCHECLSQFSLPGGPAAQESAPQPACPSCSGMFVEELQTALMSRALPLFPAADIAGQGYRTAAHHISLHLDPQFLSALTRMSDDGSRNIDLATILNLVQHDDGVEAETQVQMDALHGDEIGEGRGTEAQNANAIIHVRLGGSVSDNQDLPAGVPQRTGGAADTGDGVINSAGSDMENELGEVESRGDDLVGVEELSDEIDVLLEGLLMRSDIGNPGDYLDGRDLDSFLDHLAETENPNRGPPPAAKSAIANLATVRVVHDDGEESETNLCAICKEMGEEGEEMSQMPCAHLYHPDCIRVWLSLRNSCPVCRHELPTDDADYEAKKGANTSTPAGASVGSEQLGSQSQITDAEEDAPMGPGGNLVSENGWESLDPGRQDPNPETPFDRMQVLAPTESGNLLSTIRRFLNIATLLVAILLFQGRTGQGQDTELEHSQRRRFFGLF